MESERFSQSSLSSAENRDDSWTAERIAALRMVGDLNACVVHSILHVHDLIVFSLFSGTFPMVNLLLVITFSLLRTWNNCMDL